MTERLNNNKLAVLIWLAPLLVLYIKFYWKRATVIHLHITTFHLQWRQLFGPQTGKSYSLSQSLVVTGSPRPRKVPQ